MLDANNDVSFYVNGTLMQTVTGSTPMRANTNDIYRIGAGTSAASSASVQVFDGLLDQIVIEKLALDASAIQSLMREAPVLNLHLDEDLNTKTFADSTQFANDATCASTQCPEAGAKGQMREAPVFDGVDDRLNVAHSSEFNSDEFTVGLWVKPTTRKSKLQPLITKEAANGGSRYFGLFINPDSMNVYYAMQRFDCSRVVSGVSGTELNENRWNHVMLSFDGRDLTLYINGAQQGSQSYQGIPCLSNQSIKIGNSSGDYSAFAGSIDEVTQQGKALDAAGVKAVYTYQSTWYDLTYHHTILIDADDPEILGLNIVDNGYVALQDSLLTISAGDASSEIAGVTVKITPPSGSAVTTAADPGDDNENATWFTLFQPSVAGQYTIQVTATDDVGRSGSLSRTFYVDDAAPTSTLNTGNTNQLQADGAAGANMAAAADSGATQTSVVGAENSNRLLRLDGTFTDPGSPASGVDTSTATYELFDWQGQSVNGRIPAPDGTAWYPFTIAGYGEYTLDTAVADSVGNWYTATVGTIAVDDLAPVADVTRGADVPLVRGGTLVGTVTDVPYPTGNQRINLHLEEAAGSSSFVDSSRNMLVAGCDAATGACPTAGVAGNNGNAAQFDGSNDRLSVPYEEALELDEATLMAWIQPTWAAGSRGDNATILSMDDGTTTGYRWQINNDLNGMVLDNGTTSQTLPLSLSSGQWAHVALVMQDGVWTGYLNGEPMGTITQTFGSQVNLPLNIGSHASGGFFAGLLDEVVIYERALDAEEIHRIAQPLSGSVTTLQLRFRTFAERDLAEDEGTWYEIIAGDTGQNFNSWRFPLPDLPADQYKIDLRAVDALGNTSYIGEAWNGFYLYADLAITKTAAADTVVPSDALVYTLSYTNTGFTTAYDTVITETVPVDTVFNASASSAGWSCDPVAETEGATCTLAIGTMEPQQNGSATFAVDLPTVISANVEVLTNTATIASRYPDLNVLDNQAVLTTTVDAAPDLVLTKDDGGAVYTAGQDVIYTFTYANNGNQVAADVQIIDYLPDEVTSNDSDGFVCRFDVPANGYYCTLEVGDLVPGDSGEAQFTRSLFADFPPEVITNTAVITESTGLPDSNPDNNWATVGTATAGGIIGTSVTTVTVNEGEIAQVDGYVTEQWLSFEAGFGDLVGDANAGTWTWTFQTSDGPDESQPEELSIRTLSEQQGSLTFDLVVLDVAPTITLTGAATFVADAPYELTLGPVVDPGNDTVTDCQLDWGDGNSESCLEAIDGTRSHVYIAGTTAATITVDLTDEDGVHLAAGTKAVVAAAGNVAPVLDAIPAQSVTQGEMLAFTATASDANRDSLVFSLGDAPAGVTIDSSSGLFAWTPGVDVSAGSYAATIIVSDGVLTDSQDVAITVVELNIAPVAVADAYTTDVDSPLVVTAPGVLANDSDVNGDALVAILESTTSNGTLALNSDGSFNYLPNPGYVGVDSFTYHVNDGAADSNTATVAITVTMVNVAPVLDVIPAQSVTQGETLTFVVTASDANGDPLVFSLGAAPAGAAIDSSSGLFVWTPGVDVAAGLYSATVIVADGLLTTSQSVQITVNPTDSRPVASDDAYATVADNALTVAAPGVLANDSVATGNPLTVILEKTTTNGVLTLSSDGSFSYQPNSGFAGVDSFTYHVTDGTAHSSTATVTLVVYGKAALADPPVTSYNTSPDPRYPEQSVAGLFTVDASFVNNGSSLTDLYFQVTELRSREPEVLHYLLNADTPPGQAGAILTVPNAALPGGDRWDNGEQLDVSFLIGLMEQRRFAFSVDLYTTGDATVSAAANGGGLFLGRIEFVFDVTAQEAIGTLQGKIQALISDGALKPGQANGLLKPLDNAIRSLDRGDISGACNQLQDFINEVNAKSPSPLTPAAAAVLVADAEAIRARIGCVVYPSDAVCQDACETGQYQTYLPFVSR
ncbi:MAG: LamG-like jellyroll fold domain-containing protein [Caldilineaceae bacterium]